MIRGHISRKTALGDYTPYGNCRKTPIVPFYPCKMVIQQPLRINRQKMFFSRRDHRPCAQEHCLCNCESCFLKPHLSVFQTSRWQAASACLLARANLRLPAVTAGLTLYVSSGRPRGHLCISHFRRTLEEFIWLGIFTLNFPHERLH